MDPRRPQLKPPRWRTRSVADARTVRSASSRATPDGAPEPAVRFESTIARPTTRRGSTASSAGLRCRRSSISSRIATRRRSAGRPSVDRRGSDAPGRALAAKGGAALSAGVRNIAVPERLRSQLRRVMLTAAARSRAFGSLPCGTRSSASSRRPASDRSARRSTTRQTATTRIPSVLARMLADTTDEPTPEDLHLQAEVDRAVENEIDRREQSARQRRTHRVAQAAGAAAACSPVASTATKAGLIGLSTGRTPRTCRTSSTSASASAA
jgi:hypothetical protein